MKSIALPTILLIIISLPINAEITLDGSLGRGGPLPGPNYLIGADLGQQHGGNLFHSFRDFNLKSHESATFSGPNRVNNIIGRVTGGNPSNIDGLIRSSIPNANLYFLNPYGIMFGPHAKLDVQGSFHASTADYLRLQDGGRFDARQPNNSFLTVAPVEAFGFLDNTIAPISVEGGGEISKADWDNKPTGLSVPTGKTLSLLGGELEIKNGTFFKTVDIDNNGNESTQFTRLGTLNAPDGRINLASVASKGEIVLGNTFLEVSSLTKLADIYISNHSLLQVSGEGGGRVFIRGEQVFVDDSAIEAKTLGNQNGSLLDIQVGSLSVAHNSKFDARLEGTGTDATVQIEATDSVSFFDRSSIDMNTYNKNEGAGDAGTVLIEAKKISFEKNAGISNSTLGKGHAGNIIIRADELFSITKNSNIYISPFSSSTGGNGGTLLIEAQDVRVEDGSYLSGTTFGPGKGGHITIHASGTVTVSEANTDGLVSGIFSNANPRTAVGNDAGNIVLEAKELIIKKGAMISSSTIAQTGKKSGQGGNITIRVQGSVKLYGVNLYGANEEGFGAGIYVRAKGDNTGNAGSISIDASALSITEGAVIASTTDGPAHGCHINIQVNGELSISGDSADITLREPARAQLRFREDFEKSHVYQSDTSISGIYGSSESSADNAGQAGNIKIKADTISLTEGGYINTSTQNAAGGNITINSSNLLYLREGQITTSVHGGTGDGGNIVIENPVFVILGKGQIRANADEGRGGNIQITSEQLIASPCSQISASSKLGIDGEVEIDAPEVNLDDFLVVLPGSFVDASTQLQVPCTVARVAQSRFVVKRIAGSPPSPDDFQSNRLVLLPLSDEQRPNQITSRGSKDSKDASAGMAHKGLAFQPHANQESRVIDEQLF